MATETEHDAWHEPTTDDPYWTETSYWGFYVPERKLSGTVYNMWRRNLGLVSSRVWVWDDDGDLPHDIPYTSMQEQLVIPDDADPTSFSLPSGLSCERTGTLGAHHLQYADGEALAFDLQTSPAREPVAAWGGHGGEGSGHFDQHIAVTGTIRLWGENIDVDCLSMRDRSWSVRPDFGLPRLMAGYMHGAASADECFLVMATGDPDSQARGETQPIPRSGCLVRDGIPAVITGGSRTTVERHRGRPRRLAVELEDELGRTVRMQGEALNNLGAQLNPSIFNWFSLQRWTYDDGTIAIGEDQETWIPQTALHTVLTSAAEHV
jgi:hypothetical protein